MRHRCAERHYLVHAHGNAALRATLARANDWRFFSLGQSFFQNISRCVRDTAVHRCADATRHQAPRPTGEDGDSESRSADTASDLSTPEKEARAAVGTGPSHKEEDDSDGWDGIDQLDMDTIEGHSSTPRSSKTSPTANADQHWQCEDKFQPTEDQKSEFDKTARNVESECRTCRR